MQVDLGSLGGSALTDPAIAVPEQSSAGIPGDLCAGAQYRAAVTGPGVGRGAGGRAPGHRRQRGGLFGLSGLPPGIHRRVREPGAHRHPRRRCRAGRSQLHAPLLAWSKERIIREGLRLGVDYALTVSCYQADAQGRACGRCDSCRLRRAGFEAAGVADPTRYAAAGAGPLALGMMRPLP